METNTVTQKIQRLGDCIRRHEQLQTEYQKAIDKGNNSLEHKLLKELNISKRRVEQITKDLTELGKGKWFDVKYEVLVEGITQTFKESFIGMEKEDLYTLFKVREFLTGIPYKILDIREVKTYLCKVY